jgi:hypothetical protein
MSISARNRATWGLPMALPIGWLSCLTLTLYAPKEVIESQRGRVNLDLDHLRNARPPKERLLHKAKVPPYIFISHEKIISSLLMLCIVKLSSIASYSCPWATTQNPQFPHPHEDPVYFNIGHIATYTWRSHGHGHHLPCSTLNRKKKHSINWVHPW